MARELVQIAWVRELIRSGENRRIRVDAGVSLADLARDCGVTAGSVFAWEAGRQPRGAAALRYSRALQDLITLKETRP